MFGKIRGKMNVSKTLLLVALVAVLLISAVSIARAAEPGAHAFGVEQRWQTDLKAHEVYVWTGMPPNTEFWTAAPVGMCQQCPCVEGVRRIETGWIKGWYWRIGNVLQQYVCYTETDGSFPCLYRIRYLSENRWYRFRVMYSKSADRWEAWLDQDVPWFEPHPLGWKKGCTLIAGSENAFANRWMDAYGWHPRYETWDRNWFLFNYSDSDCIGGGHFEQIYDFGYRAWGR